MSSIKFNPTEARAFADWLQKDIEQLEHRRTALNRAYVKMNEVWQDERYMQYLTQLTDILLALEVFNLKAHRFNAYLRKRADLVDQYLRR